MRKFIFLLIMASLVSCQQESGKPDRPVVAVSILPQKYLVTAIADTLVDVVTMVPPGASPATWEATTAQMRKLSYASAYFMIGHIGFEKAWMDRIREQNDSMKVIDLSEGLSLIKVDVHHGDHSHSGVDPHTWMSPKRMEMMARTVYYELKGLFPEYQDRFRANYIIMLSEIKATKAIIDQQLSAHGGKAFLIFHPALTYLADDYYLQQITIEYEGKEPSPAHMKETIQKAQKRGIKDIFVQAEFETRNAEIIAGEIGGRVHRIDPLAENWNREMMVIARKLNTSLR